MEQTFLEIGSGNVEGTVIPFVARQLLKTRKGFIRLFEFRSPFEK